MEKLQQGSYGEALSTLPLEFSEICRRLRKGSLPSLGECIDLVADACGEAGVEAGYAAPNARQKCLEQADAIAGELAAALKVCLL